MNIFWYWFLWFLHWNGTVTQWLTLHNNAKGRSRRRPANHCLWYIPPNRFINIGSNGVKLIKSVSLNDKICLMQFHDEITKFTSIEVMFIHSILFGAITLTTYRCDKYLCTSIDWCHRPVLHQCPTISGLILDQADHPCRIFQPNHSICFEPFSLSLLLLLLLEMMMRKQWIIKIFDMNVIDNSYRMFR